MACSPFADCLAWNSRIHSFVVLFNICAMKKEETPQDLGALGKITKEVCYVVDESGNYTTGLSNGWEVKTKALDAAWDEIGHRVQDAAKKVKDGQASPILYFMELRLMDIPILAAYTRYWKWRVRRHLKPGPFSKLSQKALQKYADAFEVSVEDLKSMHTHEA